MAQVKTNNVALSYAIESSLGVAPTSGWEQLEVNSVGKYGAEITTVARNPISATRQRKKGTITDLDSGVEFEMDHTYSSFEDFIEGFVFASFTTLQGVAKFVPTAVTTTPNGFTVASGGDLDDNTLVYARGFTNAENNGLFVCSSATGTSVNVSGGSLVAEASPPSNVMLEIAGVQGASGDIVIDSNGDIASTVLDFTTLGLTAGQYIKVGGSAAATQFATAADNGYCRVVSVATNLITTDKRTTTFVADTGTSKTIQLLFGRFLRNVATDHAAYIERSYHFEAAYADLGGVGTDEYVYAKGNYANQLTFTLPLTDKATIGCAFVGTDTDNPTSSRVSGVSSATAPVATTALNSSSDVVRLHAADTSETDLTTYFKNCAITLNNNVSPEKAVGTLGAVYVNTGDFEVDIDATALFDNDAILTAIRNNTTLSFDFIVKNADGGVAVDLPSITMGGGGISLPRNETVQVSIPCRAFEDATLGTSIGISLFPYLP